MVQTNIAARMDPGRAPGAPNNYRPAARRAREIVPRAVPGRAKPGFAGRKPPVQQSERAGGEAPRTTSPSG